MALVFPVCEVPSCTGVVFALAWEDGRHVHALCMEHTDSYIDLATIDDSRIRMMPLAIEEKRN